VPVTRPRNSSRPRRWTLKLTLALLAGAVVTWAVACGCALWGRAAGGNGTANIPPLPEVAPLGWAPEVHIVFKAAGLTERVWSADVMKDRSGRLAWECTYGWPCRSMKYSMFDPGVAAGKAVTTALEVPNWLRVSGARSNLPVSLLPLGFTLNTLLAAAVILTLTEGAGAWRRRARRRKGRCPGCGYDRAGVAGDAACPECGRGA